MPSEDRQQPGGFVRQLSMAMELPFVLVGAVAVGGGIGYLLDGKLHTRPWLTLAFGLLGFAAGLRELLRRLSRAETDGNQDGGR